jgi:hypothetical protein
LHISIHESNGASRDISQPIEIHEAHYRTGKLSVAPKFVEPGPSELQQIAADSQIKTRVFAASAFFWSTFIRHLVGASHNPTWPCRQLVLNQSAESSMPNSSLGLWVSTYSVTRRIWSPSRSHTKQYSLT